MPGGGLRLVSTTFRSSRSPGNDDKLKEWFEWIPDALVGIRMKHQQPRPTETLGNSDDEEETTTAEAKGR